MAEILSMRWQTQSLHGVEHFDSQEIEMCPAKHLPLQKFEAVDMTLRRAITPLRRASGANSGIIATYSVDKTGEFSHMTGFGSVEPGIQSLHLAVFEHGHKFLTQEVDGAEVLVAVHLLNLLLLRLSPLGRR